MHYVSVTVRHIMEDLEGQINKPADAMTEEELQFHYFKVHDYNNDDKLDGIELISALTHHNGLLLRFLFMSHFVHTLTPCVVIYVFTVRLHVMQCTVLLLQFCLSVRLSVRRMYCDKTE